MHGHVGKRSMYIVFWSHIVSIEKFHVFLKSEKLCLSLERKRTEVSGKRQKFYDLLKERTML